MYKYYVKGANVKSFKEIRERKKTPKGETVFSSKAGGRISKVSVSIVKELKGFSVYIDGDKLDTFKSQSEAMKALKSTVKELGGKL